MRVIWISVGLLAVFLVILLSVYEPAPEQTKVVSSPDTEVVNPFVEDTVDPVSANKPVELAVLPTEASQTVSETIPKQDESQSSHTAEKPELPQNTSAESIAVSAQSGQDKVQIPNQVNTQNASQNEKQIADNKSESIESLVVVNPEENQPEKKKPGLAMLVFEKEKKKNKVAVIVHESNSQELTEKEIKALYLDRLTRWQDGSKVMLYDLPLGDKYRDKFSRAILKMSALEADKQESKRRALRIKANDVEVKAKNVVVSYVEQHPNAVAYVPLNLVREKSNVKVILTIP